MHFKCASLASLLILILLPFKVILAMVIGLIEIIMYPKIQQYSDDLTTNSHLFDRKGVSSQSDGTAQFIVEGQNL